VCVKHGARKPETILRGADHPSFKQGRDSLEGIAKKREHASVLRSLEDMLFLCGELEGQQHTRHAPAGYEKIHTLEQAQAYIHKLEAKGLDE
jgi:hypothetical protein